MDRGAGKLALQGHAKALEQRLDRLLGGVLVPECLLSSQT